MNSSSSNSTYNDAAKNSHYHHNGHKRKGRRLQRQCSQAPEKRQLAAVLSTTPKRSFYCPAASTPYLIRLTKSSDLFLISL